MFVDLISIPVTLREFSSSSMKTKTERVIRSTKRTANGHALQILKLFHKTTKTWDHQPEFHFKTLDTADGVVIEIWTDDEIYRYLDEGTDKRYAVMTDPFVPKTIPGVVGSFTGTGGFSHFDWRNPRDGIKAREFTNNIYADRAPKALDGIEKRFNEEVSKILFR